MGGSRDTLDSRGTMGRVGRKGVLTAVWVKKRSVKRYVFEVGDWVSLAVTLKWSKALDGQLRGRFELRADLHRKASDALN